MAILPVSRKRAEKFLSAVPNIRYRWPEETKAFSDIAIAAMYENFYFSDDAGSNDEKLPTYFSDLPEHEAHFKNS